MKRKLAAWNAACQGADKKSALQMIALIALIAHIAPIAPIAHIAHIAHIAPIAPMHFSSTISKFDSNLWGFHFIVPEPVGKLFVEGTDRRVVCTLNGVVTFQCALMPHGDGNYFINVNKSIRDRLKLTVGSKVEVSLIKDESEYGLTMCEEMKELLEMDEDGNRLFHALTPGKQRSLIYWVATPKNTDGRIRRALVLVEHLKATNGKTDFKVLNQLIKIDPGLPR